jgi:hypothetical protein
MTVPPLCLGIGLRSSRPDPQEVAAHMFQRHWQRHPWARYLTERMELSGRTGANVRPATAPVGENGERSPGRVSRAVYAGSEYDLCAHH